MAGGLGRPEIDFMGNRGAPAPSEHVFTTRYRSAPIFPHRDSIRVTQLAGILSVRLSREHPSVSRGEDPRALASIEGDRDAHPKIVTCQVHELCTKWSSIVSTYVTAGPAGMLINLIAEAWDRSMSISNA